ncbi:uncharacterized protein LOC124922088 [Impatiens glandulifera]|uniref:uncharacterized protein LOC124922088 n=1 Tax=Impatiens glandulifera TaxID=253017 RepID=UPI001FB0708D|nr:uncharacterized protein LOC124922088 [Impatiens glandulifera]
MKGVGLPLPFSSSDDQFWNLEGGSGGGFGWATIGNTLFVLVLLSIWHLAAINKTLLWFRLRLGFVFTRHQHTSNAQPVNLTSNSTVASSSSMEDCSTRVSELIPDSDLTSLIDILDDKFNEDVKWVNLINRKNNSVAYEAKCCKPKDGPMKYLSLTILDNCSPEMLQDFYMNNDYRKQWDKTFIDHHQLQLDKSGTEICQMIKKFPLLTPREYIIAWRTWKTEDGTFYCISKECEHPMAPIQKKYVRVKCFRSGWRISKVPGRNASEIKLIHQEDAGLNPEMAKLAFTKGIWDYICKMDNAFRKYNENLSRITSTEVLTPPPTATTLKTSTEVLTPPPTATTLKTSTERVVVKKRKLVDGDSCVDGGPPTKKSLANVLILLGGVCVVCCSQSNLGAKVATAFIWSKLTKPAGASFKLWRRPSS